MTGYVIAWFGANSSLNLRYTSTTLGALSTGVADALGISPEDDREVCIGCDEHVDYLGEYAVSCDDYRELYVSLCDTCSDDMLSECEHGCGTYIAHYGRARNRLETALNDAGLMTGRMGYRRYLGEYSCDACGTVCGSCAENLDYCEDCDVTSCNECEDCYGYGDSGLDLESYSHKPRAIIHGRTGADDRTPTFGMELETAYVTSAHVDAMNNLGGEYHGVWYAKEDSTVRGAEFVSHPMTYAAWTEHLAVLEPVLRTMIAEGANNGGIDGNGIHVHVGRDAFGGRAHLARFALMVDNGRSWVTKLARRDSPEWSAFGRIKANREYYGARRGGLVALTAHPGGSRGAVNLGNYGTVEVRVWKQSLETHHVIGAIALVAALVEYTRTMTVQEVMAGALSPDSFADWLSYRAEYAPVLSDLLDVLGDSYVPTKHYAVS